ncbi:hypothetical protein H257_19074 [Aphanomyces astaci]|uniref:Uncharacterized protein n=1 Tax=Aphanomyces astaci TaxID=112090 RepID=W4FAN6_APHAT|nr:hypothetical protein H257_19074 [Aphanomyces astaci]ETV63989.1 hypothetical protein H257_19074 [Aphanomyces astaci]|eukprot:XP_009846526.1 hypothetical protein H257_19074 [Aphanomyces astaci]
MTRQPTARELSYAKKKHHLTAMGSLVAEQSFQLPPNSTSTEPPSPVLYVRQDAASSYGQNGHRCTRLQRTVEYSDAVHHHCPAVRHRGHTTMSSIMDPLHRPPPSPQIAGGNQRALEAARLERANFNDRGSSIAHVRSLLESNMETSHSAAVELLSSQTKALMTPIPQGWADINS